MEAKGWSRSRVKVEGNGGGHGVVRISVLTDSDLVDGQTQSLQGTRSDHSNEYRTESCLTVIFRPFCPSRPRQARQASFMRHIHCHWAHYSPSHSSAHPT